MTAILFADSILISIYAVTFCPTAVGSRMTEPLDDSRLFQSIDLIMHRRDATPGFCAITVVLAMLFLQK
ncbi:MAG: hypothetical protein U9Q37_07625 [Euryarchaeota archaeon]|nr:hypothetical protein [Euryarchaeota archaeon]